MMLNQELEAKTAVIKDKEDELEKLGRDMEAVKASFSEKEAAMKQAQSNYARIKSDREKIKQRVKNFQDSVRVRIAELRKDEGSLILAVKAILQSLEQNSPLSL